MTHDYQDSTWSGFAGAPIKSIALADFHPFETLDEASTLRFTLESGKTVEVLLRTTDGYLPFAHDAKDDGAVDKGIGEEKVLTGTLEIPPALRASKDPEVRAFVAKYLAPYHHVPNLFVLDADLDHVDLFTSGRYRKSDAGFDYAHAPACKMSFTRDARGESLYERIAADPLLRPNAAMSVSDLDRVIADNERVQAALTRDVSTRQERHFWILVKTFFLNLAADIAFFFMNLFGLTKKPHMGPISDLVPRFLSGHLHAHDLGTPAAFGRANATIARNLSLARQYRVARLNVPARVPPARNARPAAPITAAPEPAT